MKKLIALSAILILACTPVFAQQEETKAHPISPFNIVEGWLSSLGEGSGGTSIWKFEEKSTLTAGEVVERRDSVGAGMRGRVGEK